MNTARPGSDTPEMAPSTATLKTYFPLFLVVFYLVGVVALAQLRDGRFDAMRMMSEFMGGFFLSFSFFKLLNIRGFSDSYRRYDILAKHVPGYAIVYPFIELMLGVSYVLGLFPLVTNGVTLAIMLVSSLGVVRSLLRREEIPCACLGVVLNLPMSKITLIEDLLMVGMSATMTCALL